MRRFQAIIWFGLVISAVFSLPAESASRSKNRPTPRSFNDTALTRFVDDLVPDSAYWYLLAPLDTTYPGTSETALLFHAPRIICPDQLAMQKAVRLLKDCKEIKIKKLRPDLEKARSSDPAGYRGITVRFEWQGQEKYIQLLTFQQLRWLLWAKDHLQEGKRPDAKQFGKYAIAVSDHLDSFDNAGSIRKAPTTAELGIESKYEFLVPLEDDLISLPEGVQAITTTFAHDVTGFTPTEAALVGFKLLASDETLIDTCCRLFQLQCNEFFGAGRRPSEIQTLTANNFRQLATGTYAFAVDVNGDVQFLPVDDGQIGHWSGLPHTLFFHNDPVLTAGTFTVVETDGSRLASVNIRAHVLWGDILAKPDAREQSDRRLTSLGHFFKALDRLGIPYSNVLISKL